MCDELTEGDNQRLRASGVSRRDFGIGAAAVGAAMVLPSPANALEVKARDAVVTTPDGQCDAYFVAPASGRHPGIVVWPDIFGLRPAFRKMADRLAQSGYAVLTINPFYRSVKAPIVAPGEGFSPAFRERVEPYRAKLTPAATTSDAKAFVAWLDTQREVDTKRGIGSTGYCMGGPMVMMTAAAMPARVRAGATFHGGMLASDAMLAIVPATRARWLVAIAENDDARSPDDKVKLRTAFDAVKEPAEIEVYKGTMHGWCPPDSQVYNAAQADHAWARQLALLATALA